MMVYRNGLTIVISRYFQSCIKFEDDSTGDEAAVTAKEATEAVITGTEAKDGLKGVILLLKKGEVPATGP